MSTAYRDALESLLTAVDARGVMRSASNRDLVIAADRARELLSTTRREFFVVVAGQDASDGWFLAHEDAGPRRPIAWETYLDESNTLEKAIYHTEQFAATHKWARVGRLIVEDWPEDAK